MVPKSQKHDLQRHHVAMQTREFDSYSQQIIYTPAVTAACAWLKLACPWRMRAGPIRSLGIAQYGKHFS